MDCKVVLLNKKGNPKTIYVFGVRPGADEPPLPPNTVVYSKDNQRIHPDEPPPPNTVVYSKDNQRIHPDDPIHAIKKKIIHEIGESNISYDEIFLFANKKEPVNAAELYHSIVNEDETFTGEMLRQLCDNIIETGVDESLFRKPEITIDDLMDIFKPGEFYPRTVPVGHKYNTARDRYLFSANPFLNNKKHPPVGGMQTAENELLLNVGDIDVLFLCLAQDVLEKAADTKDDAADAPAFFAEHYFPFLFKNDISNPTVLREQKQRVLSKNKDLLNRKVLMFYKSIDAFYSLQEPPKKRTYLHNGIIELNVRLFSTTGGVGIPLDIVFKNIHATTTAPFIKYNPGVRQENIYRLYSKYRTNDGKHIPFLSEPEINKLSKTFGKPKQITLYIHPPKMDPIYLIFENNGDLSIQTTLTIPTPIDEITIFLKENINPIIDDINQFLTKTGYEFSKIESLTTQPGVEVSHIKYTVETEIEKYFELKKYEGCLRSIFNVAGNVENMDDDLKTTGVVQMRFKRVENFQEGAAQNLLIAEILKKRNDLDLTIKTLRKDNPEMTEENAKKKVVDYLNERRENEGEPVGAAAAKGAATDQVGFLTTFQYTENKIRITVENVISINYLTPLFIYLDGLLKITQAPTSIGAKEMKKLSDKMLKENITDEIDNRIKNVEINTKMKPVNLLYEDEDTPPGFVVFEENAEDEEPDEPEDADDSRGFLFEDDDMEPEDEDDDDKYEASGGDGNDDADDEDDHEEHKTNIQPKIQGTKLKNPNYFYDLLKKRDPDLFKINEDDEDAEEDKTAKNKKKKTYPSLCQSNARRLPIILTEKQFNHIDKEKQSSYMKYGSDPKNEHYFMCPRYWCLKTNTSMTEEDIKNGKCAGLGKPDKIIPYDAKEVPNDAFVYEFVDNKGKHHPHPGFIMHENKCLPCCFAKQNNNFDKCVKTDNPAAAAAAAPTDDDASTNGTTEKKQAEYILGAETEFPIRKRNRFGFLPPSVARFFQINVEKDKIKSSAEVLLRYSVEQPPNQSFMGVFAEIYANEQGMDEPPDVKKFKQILKDVITLDKFVQYNNGSLITVFKKPDVRGAPVADKYKNTEFFKRTQRHTDTDEDKYKVQYINDTIRSYENFIQFLMAEDSVIDHTYLWDIVADENPDLMKDGLNLIILEIGSNIDKTIRVLCPTNSNVKKIFDPTKRCVLVIKKDNYYEPMCIYKETDGVVQTTKSFSRIITPMKQMKKILTLIEQTLSAQCRPLPGMPKKYKYPTAVSLKDLFTQLKTHNYIFQSQVINLQNKIIGVVVKRTDDRDPEPTAAAAPPPPPIFVPCFPSVSITELKDIPVVFMDAGGDDPPIWNDYNTTLDELEHIHATIGIPCKPISKVVESGKIMGVLTQSNQFVKIVPTEKATARMDALPVVANMDYILADRDLTAVPTEDEERTTEIQKISLETQFFLMFQTTIRQLLNDYKNKNVKMKMMEIYETVAISYKQKLLYFIECLKRISNRKILFAEMDTDILKDIGELAATCQENKKTNYWIKTNDGICQLIVPKTHLLSGVDNEKVYFARLADDLLRNNRIRVFMTQPKTYLNITNTEYKINPDEFIILQSTLQTDYLKGIVPFNTSQYVQNVAYETAAPYSGQIYANEVVPLEHQAEIMAAKKRTDHKNINENTLECIENNEHKIIGNNKSLWARIFTSPAVPKTKEIVFKFDPPGCTFHLLIYIFQDYYQEQINLSQLKRYLCAAYATHIKTIPAFEERIIKIFKNEGKIMFARELEESKKTLDDIIMDDQYYMSDLDIWMFFNYIDEGNADGTKRRIQICLFNPNKLRGTTDLEWIIMGKQYTKKHYFIRTGSYTKNKPMIYNLIYPSHLLETLAEFNIIVKSAINTNDPTYKRNVQTTVRDYIENYQSAI